MPKLHHISKKFLEKHSYRQCLANSQRIKHQQNHDIDLKPASNTSNNHHHGGGQESLLNGTKKKEESKIEVGAKKISHAESSIEEVEVDVLSIVDETCHQNVANNNNGCYNGGHMNTTTAAMPPPPAAAAAGVSTNLKRRENQDCIWVRIGTTDHPAFELYNPDNPDNTADSSTVWVEYTSNQERECVSRSQIKYGLGKRHRPNYFG